MQALAAEVRQQYLAQMTEEESDINHSVSMEAKLSTVTRRTLARFDRGVADLTPTSARGMTSVWNADTERYALAGLLSSYHDELIAQGPFSSSFVLIFPFPTSPKNTRR